MTVNQSIPAEIALKLCNEIRAENRRKLFSVWRLQCFFCYRFSGGDTGKLCISSERGCNQVNSRYKLQQNK